MAAVKMAGALRIAVPKSIYPVSNLIE